MHNACTENYPEMYTFLNFHRDTSGGKKKCMGGTYSSATQLSNNQGTSAAIS
jgi:hypothetical protein